MGDFYIYCDGGLSNRLGEIISGSILSKKLNVNYKIIWNKTHNCDCDFDELFEMGCEIKPEIYSLDYYLEKYNISNVYWHYKINLPDNIRFYDSNIEENYNVNLEGNTLFAHHSIPEFIDESEILESLKEIKINSNILEKVDSFVNYHKIDSSILGVHVRKTDFYYVFSDDFYSYPIFNYRPNKVFVCSDSRESEEYLQKNFDNVIIRKKNSYPEKIKDGNWVLDGQGNINRNKESVIEGFIDMLILSHTSINQCKIGSTFFTFANLFNKLRVNFQNESKYDSEKNSNNSEILLPNSFEETIEYHLNKIIPIKGIIQIGANIGQEVTLFEKYTKNILLIEPLPYCHDILKSKFPNHKIISCAIGTEEGIKEFNIASNGGASSSLLTPILHQSIYPEVEFFTKIEVEVNKFTTLANKLEIDLKSYNILLIDTQGSDLDCIKSFEKQIENFNLIICEIFELEFYEKNPKLVNFVDYLSNYGFELIEVFGYDGRQGDAFFIKK